jgi:hypothetical protein
MDEPITINTASTDQERSLFIAQWQTGLHIRHLAHSQCFSLYEARNRTIGLTSTILAALVSTAVIVSFTKSGNITLQAIAGSFSVLATLFAAANTFLKYGELATKHEVAASSFGQLRRELELSECWDGNITKDFLATIMNKWGDLEKASPDIPNKLYAKAEHLVEKMNKAHESK